MPLFGLTFHRLSRPPPSALMCPPIALMGMACGLRRRCGLCSGVAPVVCWCMHRASRCGTAAGRAERFANRLGEASGAAWLGRSHRPHPSWRPGDSFFRRPSPLVVSISFYQRARHTTKGLGSSFYSRLSLCPTQGAHEIVLFFVEPSSRPLASRSSGMRGNAGFHRWLLRSPSPSTRVWLFCSKIIWCGVVQWIDCSGRTAARRAVPKLPRVNRGVPSKLQQVVGL